VLDVEQTDVGLVDERRGLQTVAHPFASHTAARNPMQLRVDDGDQTLQRLVVAVAPRFEQPRDVVERIRDGRILRLFSPLSGFDPRFPPPDASRGETR
jgi:hypothetical protein